MQNKNHMNYLKPMEAVLPTYDQHGNNACIIIYANGETKTVIMSVRKFMSEWAYSFRVHIPAQRKWSGGFLNQRNLTPIIINEDIALIPVKIRTTFGTKDGCYGYIRQNSIKDFDNDNISLHNGVLIPYLSTIETLRKKIRATMLLQYTYKEELMIQQRIYNKYRGD